MLKLTGCFAILGLFFISCKNYKNATYSIATVDNNVCKKLSDKVILYAVFVDSKYTQPWSAYDITSTIDSIKKAKYWIEKQAAANGIDLDIQLVVHRNKEVIPILNNFSDRSLSATLFSPTLPIGITKVDRWADKVSRTAGQSLPKDTSKKIKAPNQLSDRERIIARLRDIYQTDNVALMFFVNNYYKAEISVAMHTSSFTDIEYGIVSFKKPAVICHEFLHLFGAWDLYQSPFLKKRKAYIKKDVAERMFPNEIMAFAHRDIDSLQISPFTKYLIGWDNELDEKYKKFFGKKIRFAKN